MADTLLSVVRRYADAHADTAGVARTPIAGLTVLRATAPTALDYAISNPLVALVVQGDKHVTTGERGFDFGAGESLLITADVPTLSRITRASVGAPYMSLVPDLDPAIVADLVLEMGVAMATPGAPVQIEPTDEEVADAAVRLMKLLDRPASLPVLQAQMLREMHYWLLCGRHGPAIRALGYPEGQARRIARAVAVLRSDFALPLPVEHLAAVAGMSLSSFHQHFRAVTSLSPLQFQKRLRLIEARRLMRTEAASPAQAAFAVGYESVHQFTREYGRMFGTPPARDTRATRDAA